MIPTFEWLPTGVNFLDQTKLPLEETYVLATDYKQVATAIRDMIVRGAPALGVSSAMGMAIGIARRAPRRAACPGESARPSPSQLHWPPSPPPAPKSKPPPAPRPAACTTKIS